MSHTLRCIAALATVPIAAAAHAHEGHGLGGFSHWHATDVLGFLAALAAAAGLVWWHGRK
jgi:hypothetical protein